MRSGSRLDEGLSKRDRLESCRGAFILRGKANISLGDRVAGLRP